MFTVIFMLLITSANSNYIQNKEVATYIDASTQLIHVRNVITIQNIHSRPQLSYIFLVDPQWTHNISFITAKDEREKSLNTTKMVSDDMQLKYEILFADPVLPGRMENIYIKIVISNYLQSYPKTVKQGDKHLVLFCFNVYYYSLYWTQKQSTFVHLGTNEVISIDGPNNKSNINLKKGITYGSYINKEPMSQFQSIIHFESNSPFLSVEKLQRFIQLSHWGYIKIMDDITIINAGPEFKGPFERINDPPQDTRIESFNTALPPDAVDICIRDEIGLLWSFYVNKNDPSKTVVNIKPRFIMYGGWKTRYQISYSLPISNYVDYSPRSFFSLSIPTVDKIFPQIFVKEARINIILPEGARYQSLTPDVKLVNNTDNKYCYFLDVICREIVSFDRYNLVDEHAKTIQLTYFCPQILLLFKPFIIASYLYILFLLFIIYTHAKQSKGDETKNNRIKVVGQNLKTTSLFGQTVVKTVPEKSKQKTKKKNGNRNH